MYPSNENLKNLLEESLRIQASALINIKQLIDEDLAMAATIFGISVEDAKAIKQADLTSLQKIASTNHLFTIHAKQNAIKSIIENLNSTHDFELAKLTSVEN